MRIGIVGAGALGGLFGAKLTAAGEDVALVDTWPEHVNGAVAAMERRYSNQTTHPTESRVGE